MYLLVLPVTTPLFPSSQSSVSSVCYSQLPGPDSSPKPHPRYTFPFLLEIAKSPIHIPDLSITPPEAPIGSTIECSSCHYPCCVPRTAASCLSGAHIALTAPDRGAMAPLTTALLRKRSGRSTTARTAPAAILEPRLVCLSQPYEFPVDWSCFAGLSV